MAQTLVRLAGIAHGAANAAMLPHTLAALERRRPARLAALAEGLPDSRRSSSRAVWPSARERLAFAISTSPEEALEQCAAAASERAELGLVPPAPDVAELRGLYEAAW